MSCCWLCPDKTNRDRCPDHRLYSDGSRGSRAEAAGIGKARNRRRAKNLGQRWDLRPGRAVLQSKTKQDETEYLPESFCRHRPQACLGRNGIRTSKIAKYWRDEP